jgi:AcrR family transcriptional regulator
MASKAGSEAIEVREKILETACDLFYRHGARAVGVDLVVEKAGVAKTSLYRHFGTKDELVAAVLERQDLGFWHDWDRVAQAHAGDPRGELDAQLDWIGDRAGQPDYRGCPQINIAAEFPEADHPARKVAIAHKRELRRRLRLIAEQLGAAAPDLLAGQLAVLINGAFVSTQIFAPDEASPLLRRAAAVLLTADASPDRDAPGPEEPAYSGAPKR